MKLKRDIVKILSLALGLAIGVVLIAKVCFELDFDKFYDHRERVYTIMTGAQRHEEDPINANQISGAVAPGFREFIPGVEVATRITPVFDNHNYYTEEKNRLTADLIAVDTSFFDIFTREIFAGDPHKIFADWGKLMVSHSFAQKLGGVDKAIGQVLYNESLQNAKFTIEGVYEDFPKNSSFGDVEMLLSMSTLGKRSTGNWIGNDRYRGWVKLAQGVDPNSLTDAIHKMQEQNQPLEEFEKSGLKLWYYLESAGKSHLSVATNRNMVIMLALVAFILIAASVINYVLNAISSVVTRAKEVGVRKCYGAQNGNIMWLLFKETGLNMLLSGAVAVAIVLAMQGWISKLLDASLGALFTPQAVLLAVGVCTLAFLVSAVIPARIFMGIPVSTAFRNYRESKRKWKLAFLGVQFTFTTFMVVVLIVFARQYDMMLNDNLGYEYDNVLIINMPGSSGDECFKVNDAVAALPVVQKSAVASTVPVAGSSGNNVYLPGDERELFNIADQYNYSEGAAEVFGIKFLEGREAVAANEVAVSRKFVEKMQEFADWSDGAIGKGIILTEHSQTKEDIFTICGVYEDYKIGGVYVDERPSIRLAAVRGDKSLYLAGVVLKVHELTPEAIASVQEVVDNILPDKEIEVMAYADGMMEAFVDIRNIKDAILLGGLFSLIISIFGLIGYIRDETYRRSAEMAVRKINGALPGEIVGLFVFDVLKLAVVAAVLGNIAAYVVSDAVLERFAQKVPLDAWMFVAGSAAVILIITATVAANSLRISRANPVDSLKNE
ncbi:MAG: ABC transporter permease [Bacteroidales bacterium]|nr:ABC transporter permease [Bacteroidales bacterium]